MSIKLNDAEMGALMGLSDLQFRVYVAALRPYMDYATGIVGRQRRVSYQGINEDTYVEPEPGIRVRGNSSKYQLHRILKALERTGLISLLSEDRHLILRCILADTDNSVQNQAATRPQQGRNTGRNENSQEIPLESRKNGNRPQMGTPEVPPLGRNSSGIRIPLKNSVTGVTLVDEPADSSTSSIVDHPKKNSIPYQKILDLYHENLPMCPRVQKLTPTRKSHIRARWHDELPDLETWGIYFRDVATSDFLTGKAPPGPGRSRAFLADIDFLIREANVVKIWERKFHAQRRSHHG